MKIELKDKKINIYVYINKKTYIKKSKCEIDKYTIGQASFDEATRNILIGIFDKQKSTLVHELFHAIQYINILLHENDDKSVNFSESNAYLFEYLFQTITEKKKLK